MIRLFDKLFHNAVIRGENARRKWKIDAKMLPAASPQMLDEQLTAIIFLQSGKSLILLAVHLCLPKLDSFYVCLFSFCSYSWLVGSEKYN